MRNRNALRRGLLVVGLAIVAVLLAACSGGPTEPVWGSLSLYGDPQHILFSFGDRIVMLDPVDGSQTPLLDADGTVRLDDQGNPRMWEVKTTQGAPAKFYMSPIPSADDTLLAVSYDRGIFEVDVPTARILNPEGYSLSGQVVTQPLLDGSVIYVPYNGNNIDARTINGFSQIWELTTPQGMWSTPLLIDGVLYVGSLDHNLYALDPETGSVIWQLDLGGAVTSTPFYRDGYLYVGSFANQMYKISLEGTGSIVASYPTDDWVWGTPLYEDGVLYFGDVSGYLYTIRDDGDSFSAVLDPIKVANGPIVATPVLTDTSIIVGSRDNNVYWVDRTTGEITVTRNLAGNVLGNMLLIQPADNNEISRDLLVVSTLNHTEYVVAFAADTGERIWVYTR